MSFFQHLNICISHFELAKQESIKYSKSLQVLWKKSQCLPTTEHQLLFRKMIKYKFKTGIKPDSMNQGHLLPPLSDS